MEKAVFWRVVGNSSEVVVPTALIRRGARQQSSLITQSLAASLIGQIPVQDVLKRWEEVVLDRHEVISFDKSG